jgi:hypothetical protein
MSIFFSNSGYSGSFMKPNWSGVMEWSGVNVAITILNVGGNIWNN